MLEFPESLSEKAILAIDYYEDTIWLFLYRGKVIITDESGWLTEYGTGTEDDPIGFPRAELNDISEVEDFLCQTYDNLEGTF